MERASAQFLRTADVLAGPSPVTVERVAKATQMTLSKSPGSSKPFFEVYVSQGRGIATLSSVELRIPPANSPNRDGLLLMMVSGGECISATEVRSHYAREPDDMRPSNPSNPQRTYTLTYAFTWGDLRYQFAAKTECLILVAVDQIEGAARKKR